MQYILENSEIHENSILTLKFMKTLFFQQCFPPKHIRAVEEKGMYVCRCDLVQYLLTFAPSSEPLFDLSSYINSPNLR